MIFDSDVLIDALRGYREAGEAIDRESVRETSILSQLELLQGMRDKRELSAIRKLLVSFDILPITPEIGFRARALMEEHSLSISLELADSLIAATSIERQSVLCTGNVKHFRGIKGLEIKAYRR